MSSSKNAPIKNADDVIEKFGGLRPMAQKTDIPVTTIQGWKKRGQIPAARRREIIKAAEAHKVDLSGIVGSADNENNKSKNESSVEARSKSAGAQDAASPSSPSSYSPSSQKKPDREPVLEASQGTPVRDVDFDVKQLEGRILQQSSLITVFLILIAVGAGLVLIFPQLDSGIDEETRVQALENRVQQLEGELEETREAQGFFSGVIPKGLESDLENLASRAQEARAGLDTALDKAREVQSDVFSDENATMQERLEALEGHLNDMAGSPALADLLAQIETMQESVAGQEQLNQAYEALQDYFGGSSAPAGDEALQDTIEDNPALEQTFQGVPQDELRAAVLLFGFSQFRATLNRDKEPFAEDLQVLKNLVGEEDKTLNAALDRLAPHAQDGVFTVEGLGSELSTITGDVVVSKLKGEEASFSERASERLSQLFSLEKDGQTIIGEPPETVRDSDTGPSNELAQQITVNEAQALLKKGDLEGAMSRIQELNTQTGGQYSSWLEEAQLTMLAQEVRGFLARNMARKAYGRAGAYVASGKGVPGAELIRDEESGVRILKRPKFPGTEPKIRY
jgi:hypothetical protein